MNEVKTINNPFPGLRPFETDEYRLFFGREGQADELTRRLQRSRFLAVVGTSGSGKSSLVRAGLLPALRGGMMASAGAGWRISIMRPGSDPFGNLAHSLADKDVLPEAVGDLSRAESEAVIEATLRRGSLGLVEVVQHARLAEQKLLIVVDQFEELFRFRAARVDTSVDDDASAFVKLLLEAAQQRQFSLYIVLTMRSDFLGDCAQFQGLPEAINEGQYLIPRMTRDERRIAITGPVGVTRCRMAEPLVNRLLNDVGDNPDQLPILQHALMRTWDYWAAHRLNGEPIGLEDYEKIGGMAEALSLHADEAWTELPTERSRQVAEKLFKELTEKGADNRETRRPTQLSEICGAAEATREEVIDVIEVFRREGRSFLMPPAGTELKDDTVIDISHESLIRNWDRLQAWVDEEAQSARIYHRLAESAVLHSDGREGLLIDPALQIGLDWRDKNKPNAAWANRYHPEFNEALSYLEDSRAARAASLAELERRRNEELERERRERELAEQFARTQARAARRLRWAAVAMAALSILAIGVALYAFRMKQNAQTSAGIADQERKTANAARQRAEDLAATLKAKSDALELSKAETEKQAALAREQAAAAEVAKKAALAAKADAERDRAAAVLARTQAENNARQFEAAVNRSEMMRKGLEATQRRNAQIAYQSFENLVNSLEETLKPSGNQLDRDKVERLKIDLGWARSNLGNVQMDLGNVEEAKATYIQARAALEEVWPAKDRARRPPGDILFETYNGLGHAYRNIALIGYEYGTGQRTRIDSGTYFQNAKELYLDALESQKSRLKTADQLEVADAKRGIASGYMNLTRLYRDEGQFRDAEQSLNNLVDFQTENGDKDANVAARRELAEFYRDRSLYSGGKTNETDTDTTAEVRENLEKAEAAYNRLLDVQEDIKNVQDYAKVTQDVTSSYNELSFVYRALADVYLAEAKNDRDEAERLKANGDEKGETLKLKEALIKDDVAKDKTDKAAAATRAVSAIQSLSRRLRQVKPDSAASSRKGDDLDDLCDAAADVYTQLNKIDKASMLYQWALNIREKSTVPIDHDLRWKSLSNLTKLYRKHRKDDPSAGEYNRLAEQYSQRLIGLFQKEKPNSAAYADALIQLASLYVDVYSTDPAKSSQAESFYREARGLYAKRNDWWNQNLITFRLTKLYEKQKRAPEREQALNERVNLLTGYFSNLVAGKQIQPNDPVTLVSEYLYAINALAYFYDGRNPAGAEAAYARALSAYDYITQSIYNEKIVGFYADTLKDYAQLLNKDNQPTVAKQVTAKEMMAREKLRQFDQMREQQNVQQVRQSSATAP